MKCALAATGFINGDIEYNKAVLADTLGKCAGKADAVIFGEAFLQGFDSLNFTAGHDMAVAVSREGRVIHELCQLAKEHAIAISFGFLAGPDSDSTRYVSTHSSSLSLLSMRYKVPGAIDISSDKLSVSSYPYLSPLLNIERTHSSKTPFFICVFM